MKIIFWGKGQRGLNCLRALIGINAEIKAVVIHPGATDNSEFAGLCAHSRIDILSPEDPNSDEILHKLASYNADIFILAGYGIILKQHTINIPKLMCLNLHGGKLPDYRGSSPLNWALINGENSFSISIIKLDSGIDSGDVLAERSFTIDINITIKDIHSIANEAFPKMLIEVIQNIENGSVQFHKQNSINAGYYPLRFPADGFILWDMLSALQIHNRIRALTEPYPCAFTFFKGQKVKLIASRLNDSSYYGEPGRIYKKSPEYGLLVCASDKCLWIKEAFIETSHYPLYDIVNRYDTLTTVRESVELLLKKEL